jgi:hypothetical protein
MTLLQKLNNLILVAITNNPNILEKVPQDVKLADSE